MRFFLLLPALLSTVVLCGQITTCLYTVEGKVIDAVTDESIENATIEIIYFDNSVDSIVSSKGAFTFNGTCNYDYWIRIKAKNYFSKELKIKSGFEYNIMLIECSLNKEVNCDSYWAKIDSVNSIKTNYFEENIVNPSITSDDISEENKEFLFTFLSFLKKDKKEQYSTPTPLLPLFPIFILKKNQLGIFCNTKYELDKNKSLVDYTIESKVIEIKNYSHAGHPKNFGKLIHYPRLLDTLLTLDKRSIYVYTKNRIRPSSVTNFGVYKNECLHYYHYPINLKVGKNEKVLFGSTFKLDLEFNNYPEVDLAFKKQHGGNCLDCGYKYEEKKSFAKLKGVENLFFVYSDSFPLNNKLNYPLRGLYMRLNDGTLVSLWYEELDLFGCSCL